MVFRQEWGSLKTTIKTIADHTALLGSDHKCCCKYCMVFRQEWGSLKRAINTSADHTALLGSDYKC